MRMNATVMFLCVLAVSCAHGPSSDEDARLAADRGAIDQIRQEFEAAEMAGSTGRMRVHVTDDVVMMAPNMPPVSGAEPAMAAMKGFFSAYEMQIKYVSEEIVVADRWAFDRGTYTQTLTSKHGHSSVSDEGKYLWLYRREPDGRWRQARVIWNSSDPAAAHSPN